MHMSLLFKDTTEIKKLIKIHGYTHQQFSKKYGIPSRTFYGHIAGGAISSKYFKSYIRFLKKNEKVFSFDKHFIYKDSKKKKKLQVRKSTG
jgi:predicted transcriptional regulator